MTLVLSAADVDGLVDRQEAIDAMRAAHAELASGDAEAPAPNSLVNGVSTSVLLPMIASSNRLNLSVVKVLTDAPENRARELPTQRSTVSVFNSTTGECVAILDGSVLTRARTAATTAMATDALANPEASTLGLVGAGALAIEHFKAIRLIRPIDEVRVWSRSPETLERFQTAVGNEVTVHREPTAQAVVVASDIICALTPSREPIISGAWFQPGQHINAVGAPPRSDHREIDSAGMATAQVFVDSTATQLAKSGDALLSISEGAMTEADFNREVGKVLIGEIVGRQSKDQVTLFNSVGLAIQDLAYAALCIAHARDLGIGQEINLGRLNNP